jgi:hypothetical protein
MLLSHDNALATGRGRPRTAPATVRHLGGRPGELRAALLRTLRLGRRPTTLERIEIDRVVRLQLAAEEAAAASPDVRLRLERTADQALRRLLRSAVQRLEEATNGRP